MHNTYAWSPTGAEIAYQCSAGLCAVRLADGATRQILKLTLSTAETVRPTWSPDGTKIALQCRVQFRSEVCMVNADGTDPVVFLMPTGVSRTFPDWSPDGSRILLSGGTVLDVDDGEVRDLTDLNGRGRWSPDGRSIAIWSPESGNRRRPGRRRSAGQGRRRHARRLGNLTCGHRCRVPARAAVGAQPADRSPAAARRGESCFEPRHRPSARRAGPSQLLRSRSRLGSTRCPTPLPPDLLPGSLEVVVGGTSGTEPLVTVVRAGDTSPRPRQGLCLALVDRPDSARGAARPCSARDEGALRAIRVRRSACGGTAPACGVARAVRLSPVERARSATPGSCPRASRATSACSAAAGGAGSRPAAQSPRDRDRAGRVARRAHFRSFVTQYSVVGVRRRAEAGVHGVQRAPEIGERRRDVEPGIGDAPHDAAGAERAPRARSWRRGSAGSARRRASSRRAGSRPRSARSRPARARWPS